MAGDRFAHSQHGDAALVAAARAGDEAAWAAFVDRHAQLVWDVARGARLDRAQAAHVCSATWLRCVDHLDELAMHGDVTRWLTETVTLEARRARPRTA